MSLTPHEKNEEVTNHAMHEGFLNGFFTLVPSAGAVYIAIQQSPAFRARTNWQSRTALVRLISSLLATVVVVIFNDAFF